MVQDVVDGKKLAQANASNANGRELNGRPRALVKTEDQEENDDQTKENIFMFIPNLIGERHISDSAAQCKLTSRPL